MENQDIRWIQRFLNYKKALLQMQNAIEISNERELTDLEQQGLIKSFEFTHELAWNVMKDFAEYQGDTNIRGSRDATRSAFSIDLISDGEGWMDMLRSRNQTSHTYNESVADEISENILTHYYTLFKQFEQKMESIRSGEQKSLF